MKYIRKILTPIILFLDFITRPKPMKRSAQDQALVDARAKKLSLYQFLGCPFCVKVRRVLRRLNIPVQVLDAKTEKHGNELVKKGGRMRVPCLRIEEADRIQWMYESSNINAYLEKSFG